MYVGVSAVAVAVKTCGVVGVYGGKAFLTSAPKRSR
jgi:hypothetical protein